MRIAIAFGGDPPPEPFQRATPAESRSDQPARRHLPRDRVHRVSSTGPGPVSRGPAGREGGRPARRCRRVAQTPPGPDGPPPPTERDRVVWPPDGCGRCPKTAPCRIPPRRWQPRRRRPATTTAAVASRDPGGRAAARWLGLVRWLVAWQHLRTAPREPVRAPRRGLWGPGEVAHPPAPREAQCGRRHPSRWSRQAGSTDGSVTAQHVVEPKQELAQLAAVVAGRDRGDGRARCRPDARRQRPGDG